MVVPQLSKPAESTDTLQALASPSRGWKLEETRAAHSLCRLPFPSPSITSHDNEHFRTAAQTNNHAHDQKKKKKKEVPWVSDSVQCLSTRSLNRNRNRGQKKKKRKQRYYYLKPWFCSRQQSQNSENKKNNRLSSCVGSALHRSLCWTLKRGFLFKKEEGT